MLTLTGYGYTFVAKGVQSFDRRRLRCETAVYEQLADQQGCLVPVYLGLVKLLLPYPRDDGILMSHMLLMSYGGSALLSYALERRTRPGRDLAGVDLQQESDRTWKELHELGVEDEDVENMESNFTWCDEVKRMMRVDFHCAYMSRGSSGRRLHNRMPFHGGLDEAGIDAANATDATPSTRASSSSRGIFFHGKRTRLASMSKSEARPIKRVLRQWESDSESSVRV